MLSTIIGVLVPQTCLHCGVEGTALCPEACRAAAYGQQNCFICGISTVAGESCERCRTDWALRGVGVAAHYEGAMKELVLAMKFHRMRSGLGNVVGIMSRAVPPGQFDAVTSVPIAAARYRERGYNQSEVLARQVARRLGVPYRGLLGRETSRHQLGLGRQERLEQIKGAFYTTRRVAGRVLVVDDVITTGATLNECARVLGEAGAAEVWGLALARH